THTNPHTTPRTYYTPAGRQGQQPGRDNAVPPPQRSDFPHLGGILAHFKPSPQGLPGHIAIPELAVRSSLRGEFKRVRSPLRGGGGGFLGPLVDPLHVNGEPGTSEAIPTLTLPREVSGARLERREALLSVLESRRPELRAARTHGELRRQAVVLSGTSGGRSPVFSLDGIPATVQDRYGRNRFGKALLLARRLAEVGVPMVAIHFNEMTVCDGWDTHSRNFQALQGELLPMVDQVVSALLE